MCWRDDIVMSRWCSFCGQRYYGDLGHHDCPKRAKNTKKPRTQKMSRSTKKAK